jgi:hypothetical protein
MLTVDARQAPAPPGNLAVVVGVLANAAATEADRQKLVGKVFAGVVSIQGIQVSDDDPSLADVVVRPTDVPARGPDAPGLLLRFRTKTDDPAVQALQPTAQVRVRATLKEFGSSPARRGARATAWAVFSNVTFEGQAH